MQYGPTFPPCLPPIFRIAPSISAYKAAASCSFSSASRSRTWAAEYLNSVKPRTVESYKANIKQHIKPAVGALQLSELTAVDVQRLYNNLTNKRTNKPLSAKSKENVHALCTRLLKKPFRLDTSGITPLTSRTYSKYRKRK